MSDIFKLKSDMESFLNDMINKYGSDSYRVSVFERAVDLIDEETRG